MPMHKNHKGGKMPKGGKHSMDGQMMADKDMMMPMKGGKKKGKKGK